MNECAHIYAEFIDVVFSAEFQYEQRWRCNDCGSFIYFQLGPFGARTNIRVVETA